MARNKAKHVEIWPKYGERWGFKAFYSHFCLFGREDKAIFHERFLVKALRKTIGHI